MGEFCEKDTISVILTLRDSSYDPAKPGDYFPPRVMESTRMLRLKAGDILLREGFAADEVYVLLQGSARVLVHTSAGKMAVVETAQAPHIFGATEAIAEHRLYGATVQAASPVLAARLPMEEYLRAVQSNQEAANVTIHYLAWLAVRNMDKSELKAITRPIDILLRYLYLEAQRKELPYTIPFTREDMANELHINLRTLYRYIDRLEEQGFLHLQKAKISIDQEAFERLRAECMRREITE